MKDYGFTALDGTEIYASIWECPSPTAVVQIIHGMAEQISRYNEFAQYLNSRGFVVAGEDHRGHGKTAGSLENAGWLAQADGWQKMVDDNVQLGNKLRKDYPDLPFFIIGHSMGSFIARNLVADNPDNIDRVILSGTGWFESSQTAPLRMIAKMQKAFQGSKAKAKLIDKLAFGGNNKQFNPGRTGFEWLSRDEKQVDLYVADPYCGFVATAGFYVDFAEGLDIISNEQTFRKTPAELPILLYSGEKDPVGGNGAGVQKVFEMYKNTGHSKAEMVLNPGGRHESLNETNRTEVYKIFADWLSGNC